MGRTENSDNFSPRPESSQDLSSNGAADEDAISALARVVEKLADRISEMSSTASTGDPPPRKPKDIHVGNLHLNPKAMLVTVEGDPIQLSAGEFRILHRLVVDKPEVVSFDVLYTAYSGRSERGNQNLKAYMNRLRAKLRGTTVQWNGQIVSVRGMGYRMVGPVDQ